MEGPEDNFCGIDIRQEGSNPVPHFLGGPVGKCDSTDFIGSQAAGLYCICNLTGNGLGLAASGTGKDKKVILTILYSLCLLSVER